MTRHRGAKAEQDSYGAGAHSYDWGWQLMMISAGLNHAVSLPDLIRNEKMGRLIKRDAPCSFETAHLRRQMTIYDPGLARSDDGVWCGYQSHLMLSRPHHH